MDGAQFAKMLSDKHLLELNRMEYKYSTVSVKEFAELLRQNFAQPLPLTDFFLEISCFTCRTSRKFQQMVYRKQNRIIFDVSLGN